MQSCVPGRKIFGWQRAPGKRERQLFDGVRYKFSAIPFIYQIFAKKPTLDQVLLSSSTRRMWAFEEYGQTMSRVHSRYSIQQRPTPFEHGNLLKGLAQGPRPSGSTH